MVPPAGDSRDTMVARKRGIRCIPPANTVQRGLPVVEPAPGNGNRVRFGAFELDLRSRELRKHGLKLRVQGQPIDLLEMLILRPGELVTREELRSKLWPEETFVDFEHGLNSAINRLRGALGDHAESPRCIETLPRLGYRFIATVVTPVSSPAVDAPVHDWPSEGEARGAEQRRRMALAAAAIVGALAILFVVTSPACATAFCGSRCPLPRSNPLPCCR